MRVIPNDKDPILDQKFFDFLFPIAYPIESHNLEIYNFCKNKLSIEDALLATGSLLEKAISKRKHLTRHATIGRDFVDGSDAKSASVRWASLGRVYSAPIHATANKTGLLRCVIYERLNDKFYFFLIPHKAYENIPKSSNIEIPFNRDGSPRRNPTAKGLRNVDWWQFEVPDFDGILGDIAPAFEFAKDVKLRLAAEKAALKKSSSPKRRSNQSTKNHPSSQTPSLYIAAPSKRRTRVRPGKLPTGLYD